MTEGTRKQVRGRLNRVAGQIAGIQRMIDEDRYCVEVLNQIAAARSALDSLGIELLTGLQSRRSQFTDRQPLSTLFNLGQQCVEAAPQSSRSG